MCKNINIILFILVISLNCFCSEDLNIKMIYNDIEKVAEKFSQGFLNKKTINSIFEKNIKVYNYNPLLIDFNKGKDSGNLYINRGDYQICFMFDNKKHRDSGNPPIKIRFVFEKIDGAPVSILIKIFGKWTDFLSEEKTKTPKMYFENKINNTNRTLYLTAMDVFGSVEPEKCKFIRLIMRIETK
jgi:hypothetical protein